MARMTAAAAAVRVLELEGVTVAFGVPGAAINPFYAAMRAHGGIRHILARHVEGASHMAEGYTRARAGNIGVCLGTSGPAGTDMITGLYSAQADSIPILCVTGQAPRAKLHKEDFQAVDIESIAKPVTKWAVTVREPGQVPRAFQQAFHLMRSGRPGPVLIDLPIDVQTTEIEFDPDTYEPLPVYKPAASRRQIEKALAMLDASERPLIVAGGGDHQRRRLRPARRVRRDHRRAGGPDPHGLGRDPGRPPAHGRHGRPADQPPLRQPHLPQVRFRARHRQPLGQPPHRHRRELHQGPDLRARGHRADADRPRVQPRLRHRLRRQGGARPVRRGRARVARRRAAQGPRRVGARVRAPQGAHAAQEPLRRGAAQAAARVPGDERGLRARHLLRHHDRPVADRRRAVPARLQAAQLDQLRPGRPARLDPAGGARRARGGPRPRDRGAVRRLRLPVPDRGAGGRRAAQAALPACGGEQLLSRPDPPVAARLRDGLRGAASPSRTSTPRTSPATAWTTSRWRRGWAARRSG